MHELYRVFRAADDLRLQIDFARSCPAPAIEASASFNDACRDGDLGAVQFALKEGADVAELGLADFVDQVARYCRATVLQETASCGVPEQFAVMSPEQFADHLVTESVRSVAWTPVQLSETHGVGMAPPLVIAATNGHADVVACLLSAGAEVDGRITAGGGFEEKGGRTGLHEAAAGGHTGCCRLLLDYGADVNALDDERRTPLGQCAGCPYDDTVRLLIDRGADTNHLNNSGSGGRPLGYAANTGQVQVIRTLLSRGADLRGKGGHGQEALHVAAQSGSFEALRLLAEAPGADINAKDDGGTTALHLAIVLQEKDALVGASTACTRYLLEHGADPSARMTNGCTPVFMATQGGNSEALQLLLSMQSVDVWAANPIDGTSPLYIAAEHAERDGCDMVRRLLLAGADPTQQRHDGATPLHVAAGKGNLTAVEFMLLLIGDSVDPVCTHKMLGTGGSEQATPLTRAVNNGHLEVTMLLANAGADINHPSAYGSPLTQAIEEGHVEVEKYLRNLGAIEIASELDSMDDNAIKAGVMEALMGGAGAADAPPNCTTQ